MFCDDSFHMVVDRGDLLRVRCGGAGQDGGPICCRTLTLVEADDASEFLPSRPAPSMRLRRWRGSAALISLSGSEVV